MSPNHKAEFLYMEKRCCPYLRASKCTSQGFVWESTCTTYCLHAFLGRNCILHRDVELSPPPSVDQPQALDAFCLDWQRVGGTQLFYVPTVTECFTDYFPVTPLE